MKAREKILHAADKLFYERGFANTGVADLLEESGVHKASFYKYFREKGEVGLEYIRKRRELNALQFKGLVSRYAEFEKVVDAWGLALKREAKKNRLWGCPFAVFANQIRSSQLFSDKEQLTNAEEEIEETVQDWEEIFASYLRTNPIRRKSPLSEKQIRSFAKKILILYEGSIQLFFMTGKEEYLDEFRSGLLFLGELYKTIP
ncbi:TetR/AcrR family transcriptional regulator [Leptospira langatensis]|uniref:TetR/AcrR family transcriptional regulator n=1 Tax=Leptospira langatensis TaxID=2484983 RepID=A0A5F1ZS94_9LEPT|nr:TetR/AcrR family transcriptional regulator [Leptospira langatensis]TGK00313.1 TetR/AcrR family transcriptional regulator [Leptospira langatensis]TGL41050.1 TetR/AcrR family transcriptional regulator [Leptospira langatensis]